MSDYCSGIVVDGIDLQNFAVPFIKVSGKVVCIFMKHYGKKVTYFYIIYISPLNHISTFRCDLVRIASFS